MPVVDHDGARIHYRVEGSGPALLMICGLGYPSDTWWRLVPTLSERFTLIRPDNRGVGLTGPAAERPYTVERMAADAMAVLDDAGVARAHVIGVSMGGTIAQEIALSHADRVDHLVLGCTHPGGGDSVFDTDALRLLAARSSMSTEEAAEASIPFNYGAATSRDDIARDHAVRMSRPTDPEGYAAQLEGARQWRGSGGRLGSITAPTLVIHGDSDRLVPPANGEFIAERIAGARLVLLPGANHIFWTDSLPETVDALLAFLPA